MLFEVSLHKTYKCFDLGKLKSSSESVFFSFVCKTEVIIANISDGGI